MYFVGGTLADDTRSLRPTWGSTCPEEILQTTRVLFGELDAARRPDANARSHETADSCATAVPFKFLIRFMTLLIQWGHKLSENSKYVASHIFRG